MANNALTFSMDEREFSRMVKQLEKDHDAIDRKFLNSTIRRNAKPIEADMKQNSKSDRLAQMTAITTRQSKRPRAPRIGVRVGVINNDLALFPPNEKISAQALASIIEYGTEERFRQLKTIGIVTGRQSTGEMPEAPFLRPAWDKNVGEMLRKSEATILKKIE